MSGSNGSISTGGGITASASAGSFTGSVSTSGGAPTFEAGYGASIGPPGSIGLYGTYTW